MPSWKQKYNTHLCNSYNKHMYTGHVAFFNFTHFMTTKPFRSQKKVCINSLTLSFKFFEWLRNTSLRSWVCKQCMLICHRTAGRFFSLTKWQTSTVLCTVLNTAVWFKSYSCVNSLKLLTTLLGLLAVTGSGSLCEAGFDHVCQEQVIPEKWLEPHVSMSVTEDISYSIIVLISAIILTQSNAVSIIQSFVYLNTGFSNWKSFWLIFFFLTQAVHKTIFSQPNSSIS